MHILEEWRIRDIEQKAERAVSRLYELDSIRSDVGSLEHSVREISSLAYGLRDELEAARTETRRLQDEIQELRECIDDIRITLK